VLVLAGYSYDIEFKPTAKHGNADCLSRLPMGFDPKFERQQTYDSIVCQLQQTQIEQLPVSAREIREATRKDPVLCQVLQLIQNGWSSRETDKELTPYKTRKDELACQSGCLMWGLRVIIPLKLRNRVLLQELHSAHSGMVRMKALARMHVWWPGIDAEIEQMARQCDACAVQSSDPAKAPLHSWEYPSKPWQRLHIDFAGPFLGRMWLIVVDAYSEWPEVIPMQTTTSEKTIAALRNIFAIHGLPEQLVSDNGPQFTSGEFQGFCQTNGINHILVAPYHPSSNGKAERFVQTFKAAMRKSQKGGKDWEKNLSTFLLNYRITAHATTGMPPCELLMKRPLRTRLDIMRPDVKKTVEQAQSRQKKAYRSSNQMKEFNEGEPVWARNYHDGDKWIPATVVQKQGPLTYKVRVNDSLTWKRHVDQLKPRVENSSFPDYGTAQEPTGIDEEAEPAQEAVEAQRPPDTARRYPLRDRKVPERYGFESRGEEM
jgi:transposase InsO family protein